MNKKLYRIYNIGKDRHGDPFAMCDPCYKKWIGNIPSSLIVEEIAEKAKLPCNQCGK